MNSILLPPTGPNPAQVHNALATMVAVYGPLLEQQQRTIDLLQRELAQARKTVESPLTPTGEKLARELAAAQEEREKYYVKARVYGAIACEFRKALDQIAKPGATGVTTIAKEVLEWRYSENGGVPKRAIDELDALLRGWVARP